MTERELKHDFINNGLRIEILNQIISESLSSSQKPDSNQISDLKIFLEEHLKLLKQLQPL